MSVKNPLLEDAYSLIKNEFFNNSSIVAFIWNNDSNWSVNSVSENIEEILGYTCKEFLSSQVQYSDLIHKDDLIKVKKEFLSNCEKKLEKFKHEPYRVKTKSNEYKWVNDTTIIIYSTDNEISHYIGYISDCTQIQEKIIEIETLFNYSQDSMIITDLKSKILNFNDSFSKLLALKKEKILLLNYETLVSPYYKEKYKQAFNTLLENGFVENFEKDCIIKGKIITVNISMSILPDKKRVLLSIKNISNLKRLEKQNILASMGQIVGDIANQWREPLSVIAASASGLNLKDEYNCLTKNDIKNSTETIMEQSKYLSQTIENFRDFVNNDNIESIVSLNEVIKNTITLSSNSLDRLNITHIININQNLVIHGNKNSLIEALINILFYSRDLLKEKVQIDDNRYIFIETQKINSKKIELLIYSTSGEIDQETIDNIFNPYFTTNTLDKNPNIRLIISNKIITIDHSGTIKVFNKTFEYKNKEFTGICFKLVLNLAT